MAVSVTHKFVSAVPDGGDPSLVQPSNWNDTHTVTGLAASATTDTTNASNITTGTLPAAQLPTPTSTTLGGIKSASLTTHNWVKAIGIDGVQILAQPDFSDVSGSVAATQMPALTGDVTMAAGTTTTALSNIPADTTVAGDLKILKITAPGAPATGYGRIYASTGNANLNYVNDAGGITVTVIASTAAAHKFATAVNAAGAITYTQPALADISGISANATPDDLFYNVKDHGVKGDGTTDDTTAIQTLVTTLQANNVPYTLYFPPGTYKVTGSITFTTTNGGVPTILGAGDSSQIALNATTGLVPFIFTATAAPSPRIIVRGLYFILPTGVGVTNAGNAAISITNNDSAIIEECRIVGYRLGIVLTTSFAPKIRSNFIRDILGAAISSVGATDLSFNGGKICENTILSCGNTLSTYAVDTVCGSGIEVSGNDIEGCYGGIHFNNAQGVHFAGNYIEGSGTGGNFFIGGTLSNAIEIIGNNFGAATSLTVSNVTGLRLENNNFINWSLTFDATCTDLAVGYNFLSGTGSLTYSASTVANLPTASTSKYRKMFVTDSTVVASGNFGAIVAGTGTNVVPVYSDGTNWRIG